MRNEAFATRLNQHLQQSARSASWLARQLQVTPSTVTRWLNNETRPESGEMVLRIANALGIDSPDERQILLHDAGFLISAETNVWRPADLATEKEPPPAMGGDLSGIGATHPGFAPSERAWNGSNPTEQPQKNALAAATPAVAEHSIFRAGIRRALIIGSILAITALVWLTRETERFVWPERVPTPLPTGSSTPLPTVSPATAASVVQSNIVTIDHGAINNAPIVNINDVQNSVVIVGDSPAVQQQKARQRAALMAGEVRYYINNIDERVALVETALREDSFGEALATVRATVAPALQTTAAEGYRKLIANQQISALRQQFNSYPLVASPSQLLLQLVGESDLDETSVRFFYQQVGEVQSASESLFEDLAQVPMEASEAWAAYYQKRLALAVATLKNRAALAQVSGLHLLFVLKAVHPAATADLTTLIQFTQAIPTDPAQANQLLAQLATETANLQQQRVVLLAEGEELLEQDLKTFGEISQELIIHPNDSWEQVVAKAIALRQLGHIQDALTAFAQYGQMFKATDVTAQQYADTARQFTLQMEVLGIVDGAVYIFAVEDGSAAQKAGLAVGDIVIEGNGQPIYTVVDLNTMLATIAPDEPAKLAYLRLDRAGIFQRNTVTLNSKSLGIGYMPV